MKADHVIAAFRGFLDGNHEHAVSVLRQIEASETKAGRTTVAGRLRRLTERAGRLVRLPDAPQQIRLYEPSTTLDSVVLSQHAADLVLRVVDEWAHREALQSHGLTPRSTIVLHGPSGNGKTYLANAIASSLRFPLGVVDYGSMIDSFRGVTGSNISAVMKFAQTTPCLLFFDEADSLLCSRSSDKGSSCEKEDNRAVNQVLMELDALASRSFVVFATNRVDVLDSALIRRMAIRLEMPAPTNGQREVFVKRIAAQWPCLDSAALCRETQNVTSFAECEELVRDAARAAFIQGKVN